jgi:hypothetical protein
MISSVNINEVVLNFRNFLVVSWDAFMVFNKERYIANIDEKDIIIEERTNDWLQANWEILIESVILYGLNEFIEVYGFGADTNGASSRVSFPEAKATYRIICKPRNGDKVKDLFSNEFKSMDNTKFEQFVNWGGTYYQVNPPFDYVLLGDDSIDGMVVSVNDVVFELEKIV